MNNNECGLPGGKENDSYEELKNEVEKPDLNNSPKGNQQVTKKTRRNRKRSKKGAKTQELEKDDSSEEDSLFGSDHEEQNLTSEVKNDQVSLNPSAGYRRETTLKVKTMCM